MKNKISDLALFGGKVLFDKPIHVGRPNIGNHKKILNKIEKVLDNCWLTNNGPAVQEFEHNISKLLGVKHCIAMCNGTVALEILIRALGLSGEVIIPSFTFVATAHALQWQGITPVFCDINPETHTIDPEGIEKMITPRTSGIIGVHLWGRPCEVELLEKIAQKHKLKLMFDAAHSFGCSYKNRMIGSFGEAEVFSFHATKFCNTFEGGAVVTNNDELAAKIRLMKNFGFSGYDNVVYIGTNGKMSEVCAAMGLVSLENLNEFISVNYENYQLYKKRLSDISGLKMLEYNEKEKNNFQYIIFEVDEAETNISRDDIIKVLHAEKILARRYFYPGCHNMEPYKSYYPHSSLLLENTEKVAKKVLILPTGTGITLNKIDEICKIMSFTIRNGKSISDKIYQL